MKNPKTIIKNVCERLEEKNPKPGTDLTWRNPFTLAVSVLLSAQTTDNAVNRVTGSLFAKADNPADMLKLGMAELTNHIKTIGLFNNKAKNIIAMCEMLVCKYNSQLPTTRDELQKLSGIGRKSANVIMNVLYGEPYIAVDTHVLRLSNRLGITDAKTPDKVEKVLDEHTPDKYKDRISNWLVLHGRYVCKARKPECGMCCLRDVCRSAGTPVAGS